VRLADRPVNGFADLRRIIDDKRPGDAVAVVFLRDGEERQAAAILDTRP
jgi:S1-C subfamily serine protease